MTTRKLKWRAGLATGKVLAWIGRRFFAASEFVTKRSARLYLEEWAK